MQGLCNKGLPIKATPYEHQVRAYEFALGNLELGKGISYLMEMGTGKTITTIAVVGTISERGKVNKLLIVAPKSIVNVWEQEFN